MIRFGCFSGILKTRGVISPRPSDILNSARDSLEGYESKKVNAWFKKYIHEFHCPNMLVDISIFYHIADYLKK